MEEEVGWKWMEVLRASLTQLKSLDFMCTGMHNEEAEPDLDCNRSICSIHNILHLGISNSEFPPKQKLKQLMIFQKEAQFPSPLLKGKREAQHKEH